MANDDLISANLGLVYASANRFKGKGIEYDDLFQAGCLGLVKAAKNFDFNRGVKFSTYAVPVILGEMKRLFRDGGSIKVSRSLKELSLKAVKANSDFIKKEGREPTISQLSEILGVSMEQTAQALSASQMPLSLTLFDDDSDSTNQFDVPVDSHEEKLTDILTLRGLIMQLDEKDRKLIYLRFYKNQTQSKTATILKMTQVQVSRREKKILQKLREEMTG